MFLCDAFDDNAWAILINGPMSLGSRIRAARKAKGLTQQAVADVFQIQGPSVSDWERDETTPEPDKLPRLASLLGVSIDWLLTPGEGSLPPNFVNESESRDLNKTTPKAPLANDYPQQSVKPLSVSSHKRSNLGTIQGNVSHRATIGYQPDQPRDLPVKGTAICGEHERGDFRLNGETVDYLKRPPRLNGVEGAFAVYLIDDSMAPQFAHGDPAFIHPGQPVVPGDIVLVELQPEDDAETHGPAMVKILVRRTGTKLRLMQHNPKLDIEIDTKKVKNLYRVVPYRELFEF